MAENIVTYAELHSDVSLMPKRVYLDSNFLVGTYAGRWHAPDLLLLLFSNATKLYISTLALDEAWWAILREAVKRDRGTYLTGKYLKDHPDLLSHYYPELRRFTTRVFGWTNAVFVATPEPRADSESVRAFILQSLDQLNSERLAPRDAFHLSILQGHNLSAIVTEDKDFDTVDDLTIYRFH
jgi:predicted nucleic acid-binding protein